MPRLFKVKKKTDCVIRWIVIYPVDSAVHLSRISVFEVLFQSVRLLMQLARITSKVKNNPDRISLSIFRRTKEGKISQIKLHDTGIVDIVAFKEKFCSARCIKILHFREPVYVGRCLHSYRHLKKTK